MGGSRYGNYCDFEPRLKKNERFVEYFKEMCWLQWCVVCSTAYVKNICGGTGGSDAGGGVSRSARDDDDDVVVVSRINSSDLQRNGSRKRKRQQRQRGAGSLNYVNNCVAVFYDMIDGYNYKGRVMIPPCEYVRKVAPPLDQLPDYGYSKKTYTVGTQQKNRAYCSMNKKTMEMTCNFKFENWMTGTDYGGIEGRSNFS